MKSLLTCFHTQAPSIYIKKQHFSSIICNQYGFFGGELDQQIYNFFNHFDRDGTGTIDYREVVCCIRLLSHPTQTTTKHLMYFFDVFDHQGENSISRQDLYTLMTITCDTTSQAEDLLENFVTKYFTPGLFKKDRISKDMFAAILFVRPTITDVYEQIFWDKLPVYVHATIYRAMLPILQARYERRQRQLALEKARKWWIPREMRSRFRRWDYYTYLRRRFKRGVQFYLHSRYKLALHKLLTHKIRQKHNKKTNVAAQNHWHRKYKMMAFKLLKRDYLRSKLVENLQVVKATTLYNIIQLEKYYEIWYENAKLQRGYKKAVKMYNITLSRNMFLLWADNTEIIRKGWWRHIICVLYTQLNTHIQNNCRKS
jgi:hypothetical protein